MKIFRLAALAAILSTCAHGALVTISDTLYSANGEKWTGRIEVSWDTFTTAGGVPVPKSSKVYTITDGTVSMTLEPNEGATPSGTAYTVRYYGTRARFTETWVVPVSATPVTLASVRQSSTLVIYPSQLNLGLGALLIGQSGGTGTALAGQTTTTRKFLRQTGTGTVSAAPAWDTLQAGDIPDLSATYATAGHLHASTYAALAHDHAGTYEPANANIQAHVGSTANPHSVTAAQVGLGSITDDGTDVTVTGRNLKISTIVLGPFTLAQMNALTPAVGWITVVTDSANCTSQTVGQVQLCRYTGSAWAALGGGGGDTCTTYTVPYTDPIFQAAATSATKTLATIPANSVITSLRVKHTEAFVGAGVTDAGIISGVYQFGGTTTGSAGQTCNLTNFANNPGATATVALTGSNTVAMGTALTITAPGTSSLSAGTASLSTGTASNCIGTAYVMTTNAGITMSLGDGTTANAYAPPFTVSQAVAPGTLWNDGGAFATTAASHSLVATFTSAVNVGNGAATALTAGSVDVTACVRSLP